MGLVSIPSGEATVRVTFVSNVILVNINAILVERTRVCLLNRVLLEVTGQVASDFENSITVRTLMNLVVPRQIVSSQVGDVFRRRWRGDVGQFVVVAWC